MIYDRDWGIWKGIQKAMQMEGENISDKLLREAAADWERRGEWRVIRSLMRSAMKHGVTPHELLCEGATRISAGCHSTARCHRG